MTTFLAVLGLLLAVHAFFDFPGQGQFLSDIKNRLVPGFPWWYGLTMHALIQGAAAGSVIWLFNPKAAFTIGFCEFAWHWATDMLRVNKIISAMGDQLIHIVCKLIFAFAVAGPFVTIIWH
ncbi:membrane protein [Ralstonia phage RSL2]|uniref:DUF3307 domain-containing protein n=1 Tax=Ralstonia phage RSL2 TaxID=1585840 RepID=A0A0A8J907_9CAUD|nr:membrane protein [Ralstonia phage RSL2]BAQ02727.1 hypothetical protein [Ralstonia phage RSL2]